MNCIYINYIYIYIYIYIYTYIYTIYIYIYTIYMYIYQLYIYIYIEDFTSVCSGTLGLLHGCVMVHLGLLLVRVMVNWGYYALSHNSPNFARNSPS